MRCTVLVDYNTKDVSRFFLTLCPDPAHIQPGQSAIRHQLVLRGEFHLMGRSCNQAGQVPSSKVTSKLPRSPPTNCRLVSAVASTC